MACKNCDHTMTPLFIDRERTIHHCPRCGTIKSVLFGHEDWITPKLVGYLRAFDRMISDSPEGRALRSLARVEGITESIFTPRDRHQEAT